MATDSTFDFIDSFKFASGDAILDANGNEQVIFTTTVSAINELTFSNAAISNSPQIAATGGDTNIGIRLTPKGTGGVLGPDGLTGTPSFAFASDPDTGMYRSAANTLAFTAGGTTVLTSSAGLLTFTVGNVQFNGQFQFQSAGSAGGGNMFLNTSPFPALFFGTGNGGTVGFTGNSSTAQLSVTTSAGIIATTPYILPTYTVGTLPNVATFVRGIIYVSDGTGNKRLAVSDGTNWRFPDGNVVS